jgi:hypothetical protein
MWSMSYQILNESKRLVLPSTSSVLFLFSDELNYFEHCHFLYTLPLVSELFGRPFGEQGSKEFWGPITSTLSNWQADLQVYCRPQIYLRWILLTTYSLGSCTAFECEYSIWVIKHPFEFNTLYRCLSYPVHKYVKSCLQHIIICNVNARQTRDCFPPGPLNQLRLRTTGESIRPVNNHCICDL